MILYNNQLLERKDVTIDIEDRGYQFGDGVYEVIRIYQSQSFGLEEHLDRLERSAREISLEWPCEREQLKENIELLVNKNGLKNGIVYLQITRGVAPRNHLFPVNSESVLTGYVKAMDRPEQLMEKGISTLLLDDIRWLRCDIKSLNLLGNVLLKQEAHENGCNEAILHRNGTVTEGSSTNVFIVKDGVLLTHPADHLILNGITRQVVLTLAGKSHIEVSEQVFTVDNLLRADEVFISSTTMEITPVIKVDQTQIGSGERGPITTNLQQLFKAEIDLLKV